MQLIRAINKSNKSNNNNNQSSSANFNKVVIVAPPTQSSAVPAPVSPSVALPALKKRTSIVKQSIPPPVPPRGSPRSKSNLIGVSCSRRSVTMPKPTIDVDRLISLSSLEQSGSQKVKKWLESVESPSLDGEAVAMSIPEATHFKSVKNLVASFTLGDEKSTMKARGKGPKVSDSSLVKFRVESYNTLERTVEPLGKSIARLRLSDGGNDSGIDIPARVAPRKIDGRRMLFRSMDRFSRDGEFV